MRTLPIVALWLCIGAAAAYGVTVATVQKSAACYGGLGGGAGAGIAMWGIVAGAVVTVSALVGLVLFLATRPELIGTKCSAIVVGLFAVPMLVFVFFTDPASPRFALSCTAAYISAGGMPEAIVTVFEQQATLWRPHEEAKPSARRSPDEALHEACAGSVGSNLFIVSHTSWRPQADLANNCQPDFIVLTPAA